jgi:DNA-binding GntR family transcriptional regulator
VSSAGLSRYETDGILATRPGHGTFVPRELGRWINLILGFSEEMAQRGIRVSNRTLHDIYRMPSTVELGEMGLPLDSQIREISCARLADEAIACKVALFAT